MSTPGAQPLPNSSRPNRRRDARRRERRVMGLSLSASVLLHLVVLTVPMEAPSVGGTPSAASPETGNRSLVKLVHMRPVEAASLPAERGDEPPPRPAPAPEEESPDSSPATSSNGPVPSAVSRLSPGPRDPRLWSVSPSPSNSAPGRANPRARVTALVDSANATAHRTELRVGPLTLRLPFGIPSCETFADCKIELRRADAIYDRFQRLRETEGQGALTRLYEERDSTMRARRNRRRRANRP